MLNVIELVAWAALAAGVTWASRHRPEAIIGLTLLICSLITSAAYFGDSVAARLVLEIMQAICVTLAARTAFRVNHSISSAVVVALAVVDIALSGGLSLAMIIGDVSDYSVKMLLGWGANAIFFAHCICVGSPGVWDVFMGRVHSGNSGWHVGGARGARNVHASKGKGE